jgi:beta-phosphoglucomutase
MEDHFSAWRAVFAEYGVEIAPGEYYPMEGMKLPDIATTLIAKIPVDRRPTPDEVVKNKEKHYHQSYQMRFYPGVDELLSELERRRVPFGIVTASLGPRMRATVPAEFLSRFGTLITGDLTPRGKPYPDPYLKGAETLGVKPEQCLVVENAPLGIQAAKSAGMYCVGVCSTVEAVHLSHADETVPSFAALPESQGFKRLLK